jgi:mono/diheme cytochrome c family protein
MRLAPESRFSRTTSPVRHASGAGRLWLLIPLSILTLSLWATGCTESSQPSPTDPTIELPQLPVITSHPRDTAVVEGGTATFTVAATGAVSYTWVDELGDTVEGQGTATLTLTNIPLTAHGKSYRCVIGNTDGSVTSQLAFLSVQGAPVPLNPIITSQPMSTIIVPGGSTILNVTATGPSLRFQWYRGRDANPVIQGVNSTLVVTQVPSIGQTEQYYCDVTNSHGSVRTDTVTVRADAVRSFLLDTGAVVYTQNCSSCHGVQGKGTAGVVPPIAHSDYLMQNRRRSLEIVAGGASDSMMVNGLWYKASMPAWLGTLSPVQMAAVLTYIRVSLNDSLVTSCNANQRDAQGFATCQKIPRSLQDIATDSVSYQEVYGLIDSLFPL